MSSLVLIVQGMGINDILDVTLKDRIRNGFVSLDLCIGVCVCVCVCVSGCVCVCVCLCVCV